MYFLGQNRLKTHIELWVVIIEIARRVTFIYTSRLYFQFIKTTFQCCLTSTHVHLDLGVIHKLQTFRIQNLELLHTRMIG